MNIQTLLTNILKFLNEIIVPFLLVIAFVVFLWNIARYFVMDGANEESQEKARSQALWGILAFVIIVSLWGIVNLLVSGLGLGNNQAITPDYMEQKTGGPRGVRDNDAGYQLPGIYNTSKNDNAPTDPGYQDNDASHQLPGTYTTKNENDTTAPAEVSTQDNDAGYTLPFGNQVNE